MTFLDTPEALEIEVTNLANAELSLKDIARRSTDGLSQKVILKVPDVTDYTTDEFFLWYESTAQKIAGLELSGQSVAGNGFDVSGLFDQARLIFERRVRGSKILENRFSMVTSFEPGRERFLKKFLESLEALTYPKESWELIVMVDGNYAVPLDVELSLSRVPNIRVYSVARAGEETSRSSALRNLGATLARGEYLVFCDAKFWLSPLLLKTIDRFLGDEELWIQPLRQQNSKWMRLFEGPHDRQFREEPFIWNQVKNPWLWASSDCFCLRKGSFLQLGGFSLKFNRSGFDGTDLAYRWSQMKGPFLRVKLPVLNLETGPWALLRTLRDQIWRMHTVAESFYRLYLDREIYESLYPLMGPRRILRPFTRKLSRLSALVRRKPIEVFDGLLPAKFSIPRLSITSRVQWNFDRWEPANAFQKIKMTAAKDLLLKVWDFYRFHYHENYRRLWKTERQVETKAAPITTEISADEEHFLHEPRV